MRTAVRNTVMVSFAKSERDFLDYFKEENIGVKCIPRCGGCRCGQCPVGSKPMSLKDEREYKRFNSNLKYERDGTEYDPGHPFLGILTRIIWSLTNLQFSV